MGLKFFGRMTDAEHRREDNRDDYMVSDSKAPCVDFEKQGCGRTGYASL